MSDIPNEPEAITNTLKLSNESTSTSSSSLVSSTSSSTADSPPIAAPISPNTEKAVDDICKTSSQTATRSTITSRAVVASTAATTSSTTTVAATSGGGGEDNFENLQKAVTILAKAKQLDETKHYDEALKMYRQGVDMLLEELIVRQGTDQSRTYLRDKCNDFMNRIDQVN